ncbi:MULTISPECIES: hypothetical protein [Paracoccus]|uniref:hypothetical protein n=1 Tax=Paracoccus TaxID=265 RepID=UPI00048AF34D|nr:MULTISPECIES: hypothetical protein [Paracoccus]MBY0136902.1 hypothetical protein [Paracoccus yeei]
MSFMLKLPDERGEQLRLIAADKGITIPQVIESWIQKEIEAGTISADLPGVDVTSAGPVIRIEASGFAVEVPSAQGPTLADVLRGAAEMDPSDKDRKRRWLEGLAALSGVKVQKMAAGVRLVSPITGQVYPLAPGVAADLASQIERAAE